jgi:hypothetical protein
MKTADRQDARLHRVFWCVLDYGTGEWLLRIAASSAAKIRDRYPNLEVLEGVPGWFESEERDLARYPRFDLDNPPRDLDAAMDALASGGTGRRLYYVEPPGAAGSLGYRVFADNLAAVEARCPEAEVLPMVLAPAAAWQAELRNLATLGIDGS